MDDDNGVIDLTVEYDGIAQEPFACDGLGTLPSLLIDDDGDLCQDAPSSSSYNESSSAVEEPVPLIQRPIKTEPGQRIVSVFPKHKLVIWNDQPSSSSKIPKKANNHPKRCPPVIKPKQELIEKITEEVSSDIPPDPPQFVMADYLNIDLKLNQSKLSRKVNGIRESPGMCHTHDHSYSMSVPKSNLKVKAKSRKPTKKRSPKKPTKAKPVVKPKEEIAPAVPDQCGEEFLDPIFELPCQEDTLIEDPALNSSGSSFKENTSRVHITSIKKETEAHPVKSDPDRNPKLVKWLEDMNMCRMRSTKQQKNHEALQEMKRLVNQKRAVVSVKRLTKAELKKLNARGNNYFNFDD